MYVSSGLVAAVTEFEMKRVGDALSDFFPSLLHRLIVDSCLVTFPDLSSQPVFILFGHIATQEQEQEQKLKT